MYPQSRWTCTRDWS